MSWPESTMSLHNLSQSSTTRFSLRSLNSESLSRKRKHVDIWQDRRFDDSEDDAKDHACTTDCNHTRRLKHCSNTRLSIGVLDNGIDSTESTSLVLCSNCKQLDFPALLYGPRYPETKHIEPVDLGLLSTIWEAAACPFCRLVSIATSEFGLDVTTAHKVMCSIVPWRADALEGFQYDTTARNIATHFVIELKRDGHPVLPIHGSVPNIAASTPLRQIRTNLSGMKLPPTADLLTLKSWIQRCERTHGNKCEAAPSMNSPFLKHHFSVIDIKFYGQDETQLIKYVDHRSTPYVALSHVWEQGWSAYPRSLRQSRQAAEYMAERCPHPSKSQIIEDAVEVCRGLQQRYLWVDNLCVRGTFRERSFQIRHMDSIYSHAVFTIIAAQHQRTSAGLPGVITKRDQTHQERRMRSVAGRTMMLTRPTLSSLLSDSAWRKRGWTFQEGLLSRRCLIFTDHEVVFRCRQDMQRESLSTGCNESRLSDIGTIRLSSEFVTSRDLGLKWDYITYARLINEYSKRDLTSETDKLSAFRGTMNLLSRQFHTPFYFGLPLRNLVTSLCWFSTKRLPRQYKFPSWSWADWRGEVHQDFSLTQTTLEENEYAKLAVVHQIPGSRDLSVESSIARIEMKQCIVESRTVFFPQGSQMLCGSYYPRPRIVSFFALSSLTLRDMDCIAIQGKCEFLLLARLHDFNTKPGLSNPRPELEYVIALLLKRHGMVAERAGLLAIPASIWEESFPSKATIILH